MSGVLSGFVGFCRVLSGFVGFCRVLLFTFIYLILDEELGISGYQIILKREFNFEGFGIS